MCQRLGVILSLLLLVSSLALAQPVSVDISQLRALEVIFSQLRQEVSNLNVQLESQVELVNGLNLNLEQKEQILAEWKQNLESKETLINDLQKQLQEASSQSSILTDSLVKANQSLKDLSKQHLRNIIITGGVCFTLGVVGGIALSVYLLPRLTVE